MKRNLVLAAMVFSGLVLASCSGVMLSPERSVSFEPQVGYGGDAVGLEAPAFEAPLAPAAEPLASVPPTDRERLVIQTAALTMVVTDPVAKADAIRDLAEGLGGYVVSSYIYKTSYAEGLTADNASITVRVPAERLTEALETIKSDAIEVRSENVSGEDVTAQYVDLESRLRNLEAAEAQLMEIMDTADETEDVLAVYNELVRVRGEIEMVRGQMQYYEESAAFSSISAELIPDAAAQPIEFGGWQPTGTVKAAVEALINALQNLVDILIWGVICILPIALLVGLPLYLIFRAVRRRRAKAAASKPPAG